MLATVALLTGILILLGAPGLFKPLVTYKIYMDNAAGIKLGAPVLLAGRKIGQVEKLYSPVSKEDAQRAEAAAEALRATDPECPPKPTPKPNATPTPPETKTEIRGAHRCPRRQRRRRLSGRESTPHYAGSPRRNGHRLYPGQRELRPGQGRRDVRRRTGARLRRIDLENARYREAGRDRSHRHLERTSDDGGRISAESPTSTHS